MDILVDTLSFRCNFDSWEDLTRFLNLDSTEEFELCNKVFNFNYKCSYYFQGIRIAVQGQKGWKFYVHMSGKGCRTYEDIQGSEFKWDNFIKKIYAYPDIYVTRIDLACDEREGVFNIEKLEEHIAADKYVSKCQKNLSA